MQNNLMFFFWQSVVFCKCVSDASIYRYCVSSRVVDRVVDLQEKPDPNPTFEKKPGSESDLREKTRMRIRPSIKNPDPNPTFEKKPDPDPTVHKKPDPDPTQILLNFGTKML